MLESIPFDYKDRHPRLFETDYGVMQRTNPSRGPAPGVDDDLVYGKRRCTADEEMYYDPKCFAYEGSGE